MILSAKNLERKQCRYCDGKLSAPFLELGEMALANSFVPAAKSGEPEFSCPLSVTRCPACGLVQLTHVVPPDLMFRNYLYVSSTTKTFREHFSRYAKTVHERSLKKEGLLAVDIGSNDGLLLSCFMDEGMRAVGVEPAANLGDEANRNGRETLNAYFDGETAALIRKKYGSADVITANNVFAHIDDSRSVCRHVNDLLHDAGMFVVEFPYLVTMLDEMLFDMIYHEHLSYIALTPLCRLLNKFEMEVFAVEKVASHGGSLRVFIQKRNGGHEVSPEVQVMLNDEERRGLDGTAVYDDFARRVHLVRDELVRFVRDAGSRGRKVCGYGAPAKGNTLINFCGFGPDAIAYLIEDNPLKQGTFAPGSRIPVVPSSRMAETPVDDIVIFAWNFADEIVAKLAPWRAKGLRFFVPLPSPREV